MDPKEFSKQASGRLVKTASSNWAFVPNPLPPKIEYDGPLINALSKADTALAKLSAFGTHLPNPHLLISPYIKREAVLSSKIEGTQTRLSDLLIDEVEDSNKPVPDEDGREVLNYVRALELGLVKLETLPLSLRLVRDLHSTLMQGVRGANKTPGEFRSGQNIVGSAGSTEATAPYVPPPQQEMQNALYEWEKYLHNRDELPELIQCALMHVQFESIHPFWDGNGRVGRLMIPLFLIERKKLSQPLLYVSAFFEEHRRDYYELLQRTRTDGDWRAWLLFFLQGVQEVAADAAEQSRALINLREEYRTRVKDQPRAIALIDQLLVNPYVNIESVMKASGASFPTASNAVKDLVRVGILHEMTGRKRGRMFVAQDIFDLVAPPGEKPTKSTTSEQLITTKTTKKK